MEEHDDLLGMELWKLNFKLCVDLCKGVLGGLGNDVLRRVEDSLEV